MPMDLRSFLKEYTAAYPDDFMNIDKPMNYKHECSAVAKKFDQLDQFPLLSFNNVVCQNGKISPHRLLVNLVGDWNKLSFAIDTPRAKVSEEWGRRSRTRKFPPTKVARGEAPVQEVVVTGDDIDMHSYPVLHIHEMDPGAYITSGFLITHDPETGTPNTAHMRGFVAGPREIRTYLSINTHSHMNLAAHEQRGEPMKVAYWIGHHPAFLMGADTRLGYRESHYESAGAVAGEPLRLVPSASLGDDFMVPADAEVIIEGIIEPGVRALEAPFGEYPRYYGPQVMSPVMRVTAVTHRRDAIWDSHMVAMVHDYGAAQDEHFFYELVKKVVPQVTAIHLPRSGCGRYHCYVQMKKTHDSQPRHAMMVLLAASNWLKHVIVVDEDIDITSDRDVLWAMATRCQMDKDLVIIPNCWGSPLDPTAERGGASTKMGVDATMPAPPHRFPQRTSLPADVMERIQLEDLIPVDQLQRRLGGRSKA